MQQSILHSIPVFVDAAFFEDVRVFPLIPGNTFNPDKQRPEHNTQFPSWRLQISDSALDSEKQLNTFWKKHLMPYS